MWRCALCVSGRANVAEHRSRRNTIAYCDSPRITSRDARSSRCVRLNQSLKQFGRRDCSHQSCRCSRWWLKESECLSVQRCPGLHDAGQPLSPLARYRRPPFWKRLPKALQFWSREIACKASRRGRRRPTYLRSRCRPRINNNHQQHRESFVRRHSQRMSPKRTTPLSGSNNRNKNHLIV